MNLILLVFALVLTVVSAFYNPPRVNLFPLGVACYFASLLVGKT